MTVQEALALPSFQSAVVITGSHGLSQEVSGAMILEATDIENWGKAGQLILSSYFALIEMENDSLDHFVQKLKTIGISAFVLKIDRLLYEVPVDLINLCKLYSIPLIQISGNAKYESILLDIYGHILDSKVALLNHFFDIHQQITALALRQPSIFQILQFLGRIIHQESLFYCLEEQYTISTIPTAGKIHQADFTLLPSDDTYRNYPYYAVHLQIQRDTSHDATGIRIPSSDGNTYYLIILCQPTEIKPFDTMAVENVVSILQMEILKQNAVERKVFFHNNSVVNDLLNGRINSMEQVSVALSELELSKHPLYQVVFVRLYFAECSSSEQNEELLRHIRRRFKARYSDLSYFQTNDRLVFLYNHLNKSSALQVASLKALLDEILSTSPYGQVSYLLALSESGEKDLIPKLNHQVLDIYKLFDSSKKPQNIALDYASLGIYKLFINISDPSLLENYIDARILSLRQESPELMATLITFCQCNGNYNETGKRMFLHYKTVKYRIERIQKTWNIDPFDSEDVLQVLLAQRIFSLL